MTPAGQAILDEMKRINENEVGQEDADACKELFGIEPWNDADVQAFVRSGFEVAAENGFHGQMGTAVALIHFGYRAAQREVKQ
jgi:hypothetical protein